MLFRRVIRKPKMSDVLTGYLEQIGEPPWTSFFVKYKDVDNDFFGQSHFNWTLKSGNNYHILRTGAFPYMKYHCTMRPTEDLSFENNFYGVIKIINLGIPQLMYGLAATRLIRHVEYVTVEPTKAQVPIYFLYKEDKGSKY
ncbi:LOW QUALITY PROTEIN: uncharacterized protein C15orf61 [Phlebotomus argentipes]|uniref:LOW QUALITY PROTEIN: uncharacterized protein C15orf61 n=1 Tax=Phlebotomus argentipes TaxID=94469 RepID=UPI002892DB20|nr:LOW QUALITY PROTEIN: uncharacterized protein C15orf61 [Phlebotomus argentipes]